MNRRQKRRNLILILAISLFIPLFSSYFYYNNPSGSISLCDEMSFEDPGDEDNSFLQNESKTLLPGVVFEVLLQAVHTLEKTSLTSSRLTSHCQDGTILRC